MVKPLYDLGNRIQDFRATIRPGLVGQLGVVEPFIAARVASEVERWLRDVVNSALRSTELKSRKGKLRKQLMGGIRVTGQRSLLTMKARIWTAPWVFPHEYGAEIDGKNSPWLAIPFAYGVHPDGRAKFRSPRSWRRYGSFILTHKSDGRKFIVYRSGKELKYLYVLVDKIDIPARLGLNKMSNEKLGSLIGAFGEIYISEVLQRGINLRTMEGVRK